LDPSFSLSPPNQITRSLAHSLRSLITRHPAMAPSPHVLILGGGIAGPALGLALAKNDISSTIFEIRQPGTDQGGSITLAPHALRVIDKSLGVYDDVLARGFRYDKVAAYNDQGYRFGEIQVEEPGEEGYPAVRILRSELHRLLVQKYERLGGKMVWGAKWKDIKENEMGVEIDFEDGSTASGTSVQSHSSHPTKQSLTADRRHARHRTRRRTDRSRRDPLSHPNPYPRSSHPLPHLRRDMHDQHLLPAIGNRCSPRVSDPRHDLHSCGNDHARPRRP
jgi:hypothetical protein